METKKLDLYLAEKLYIGDQGAIRAYNGENLIWGTAPTPIPPDYSKYYFTMRVNEPNTKWFVNGRIGTHGYPWNWGTMYYQTYNTSLEEDHYGYKWAEDTEIGTSASQMSINTNYSFNGGDEAVRFSSTYVHFGEQYGQYEESYVCSYIDNYSTSSIKVYGNILSLIYGDNFRDYSTCDDSYKIRFKGMFNPVFHYDFYDLVMPDGWDYHGLIRGQGDL